MFATVDEQLAAWVEGTTRGMGNDAHVVFRGELGNCVPDFSCCRPSLEASEEVRRAFVTARPAIKHEFLAGFLMALLALDAPGKTEISRLPSSTSKDSREISPATRCCRLSSGPRSWVGPR